MEKIKVSTVSGSGIEKPLVTAFKTASGSYVVLDNEVNGTMGLPIILVSKFDNGRLVMVSEEEWAGVKESLRMIIGGNQFDYIAIPAQVPAEDIFFKQLTLPVASFEALKNAYKPVDNGSVAGVVNPSAPVEPVAPVQPVMTQVAAPSMPEIGEPVAPSVAPTVEDSNVNLGPVTPVANNPQMQETVTAVNENVVTPEEQVVPTSFVVPDAPTQNQSVAPVEPVVPVAPVETPPSVEPIPAQVEETPVDFTADKEAFLKACENMFDALVAKFKN